MSQGAWQLCLGFSLPKLWGSLDAAGNHAGSLVYREQTDAATDRVKTLGVVLAHEPASMTLQQNICTQRTDKLRTTSIHLQDSCL